MYFNSKCGNVTTCRNKMMPVAISELGPLASNPPGELNVLGHDGDSLGVDGTEVGILEQSHKISLTCLLKSSHCSRLEPQVSLKILCDLANQSLKGKLPDQQLGGLLVATNLTKSNCAWPVSMRLLHATSARSTLPGSLGSELLPGCFTSSRLTGSLLGASHRTVQYGSTI